MQVLHLNTSDSGGGAARGAYWLHQALSRHVTSRMLVQDKGTTDPQVVQYGSSLAARVARRAERLPLRPYPDARGLFSAATMPRLVHRTVNAMQPDVVNLHWVNEGFVTPENVRRIHAPVVWTLRDVWPMTGGCHYTRGCERFTATCGQCPVLRSSVENDLSRRVWHRKARAFHGRPLTFVALSEWIAREARRSALLREHETIVIPNALDVDLFQPRDRAAARAELGLDPARRSIFFSAMNPIEDRRKGFAQFREALEVLARRPDAGQLDVLVGGPIYGPAPEMPLPTTFLGRIDDDRTMGLLYAASTVTAMPSLEEAFGKVAMESMACGTPVVCLRGTGTAEIVTHLEHGYQAVPLDIADLAAGLAYVLDHPAPQRLAAQSRQHVLATYTFEAQAQAYLDLYTRLVPPSGQSGGVRVNYDRGAHE
ncbi:glycosyltransferase involved in cell wall biosynthesis [Deinococcus metalli]|uniref:Glycosyl transferase family 1 n=1 Tax=Deinococcus metalli TaxID=1141878 RepID=A0A7W8KG45_9DEIO|nr:glycosyltransferase [Deinococcus metalli]MBB5375929.1 glycosyltransferase involved in cell wall biosynthesis [Deinococcus metalli]GHF36023.1 glycosyl transferase family 1 [Deinococcus metalli]